MVLSNLQSILIANFISDAYGTPKCKRDCEKGSSTSLSMHQWRQNNFHVATCVSVIIYAIDTVVNRVLRIILITTAVNPMALMQLFVPTIYTTCNFIFVIRKYIDRFLNNKLYLSEYRTNID